MTETEAINHYIPKLPGWADAKGLAQCHALYGLIIESRPKISVEIGVFGGQGLLCMLFAHRKLEQFGIPGTYTVGIDPWGAEAATEGTHGEKNNDWNKSIEWEKVYRDCMQNITDHHLMQWCRIHREKSLDVVGAFGDGAIGVMHQDGNHAEEVTAAEVEAYAPKIADKGFWVADDCDWEEGGKRTFDKAHALLLEKGFVVISDNYSWRIYQKNGVALVVKAALEAVVEPIVEPAPPEPTVASVEVVP